MQGFHRQHLKHSCPVGRLHGHYTIILALSLQQTVMRLQHLRALSIDQLAVPMTTFSHAHNFEPISGRGSNCCYCTLWIATKRHARYGTARSVACHIL